MSDCGHNCPGCVHCVGYGGILPGAISDGFQYGGYVDDTLESLQRGGALSAEQTESLRQGLGANQDALNAMTGGQGQFPGDHLPPGWQQPSQGGQGGQGGQGTRPASTRTPISVLEAGGLAAGGLFLGRAVAAFFNR